MFCISYRVYNTATVRSEICNDTISVRLISYLWFVANRRSRVRMWTRIYVFWIDSLLSISVPPGGDSLVRIAKRLLSVWSVNTGSISGRGKIMFFSAYHPDQLWRVSILLCSSYFSGVKRLWCETCCLHSSSVHTKIAWSYASTLPHVFMLCCLTECRGNFTFIFSASREVLCYSSFRNDFLQ